MKFQILALIITLWINNSLGLSKYEEKFPTVLIAINIRNKAHVLPYFFSYLEDLNYPTSRLSLFIRSDHNEDNSIELIKIWLNRTSDLYHDVDFSYEDYPSKYENEVSPIQWPNERFSNIINLKEEALDKAEELWSDFIFFLDSDILLTNPKTLEELVSFDLPIVAPMLHSEKLYSNFWGAMSKDYYYEKSLDYAEIYDREKLGNFKVPMVYSAVLVNLRYTNSLRLTFDYQKLLNNQKELGYVGKEYDGPLDDIIIFAISANSSGIPMFISNTLIYGYLLIPLHEHDDIKKDLQQLQNLKINIIYNSNRHVLLNEEFEKFISYPKRNTLSLDHIYVINLDKREDRVERLDIVFQELGLQYERFPAVDGSELNKDKMKKMGIRLLPDYEDPTQGRPMTMGEIGCFLSHYRIWEKMIELNQKEVLILEDDVRFLPNFVEKAANVIEQARAINKWDLLYLGRKRYDFKEKETNVSENLVIPGYSYWLVGYVLKLEGAKKLVKENPLKKLIPADEYIPMMYGQHPNQIWAEAFKKKNLVALSAEPTLLIPTHFSHDIGIVSDTENSECTSI